jgi:tetratricopeptide (TPR) repeat protein
MKREADSSTKSGGPVNTTTTTTTTTTASSSRGDSDSDDENKMKKKRGGLRAKPRVKPVNKVAIESNMKKLMHLDHNEGLASSSSSSSSLAAVSNNEGGEGGEDMEISDNNAMKPTNKDGSDDEDDDVDMDEMNKEDSTSIVVGGENEEMDRHKRWYNLGIEMEDEGRYEEALEAYERAVELNEEFPEA